ncbi:globin family protein [Halosegnis longus]|uniref:hypothetical protein n=1 Tax=Halosegnis longus TaxID=2216012 RepID=UPI001EF08E6B|nr:MULTISPECIES: hypothetical protein [Halobacteriales]
MTEEALYDRLRRDQAIRRVVDDFYNRLLANAELGPFFGERIWRNSDKRRWVFVRGSWWPRNI